MEINITEFARNNDLSEFSASIAETGLGDIGLRTWRAACIEGEHAPFLKTNEDCEAFRDWIKGFGAWDKEERNAWSLAECNGLLIQFISGDLRELTSLCPSDENDEGIDWQAAEKLSERGTIAGRIFGGDGQIYFSMSD